MSLRGDTATTYITLLKCTYQSESCHQAYGKGPSDHTGDSDKSNSFQHHSDITNCTNIDLGGGESDSKRYWRCGDSDKQPLSLSELLWPAWGKRIHIDTCIIVWNT